MARTPRPRRQVRPATLRVARLFGFRYDPSRDAYVLRVVGGRFGPVIRTTPHDSASDHLEWLGAMEELAERRRKKPGGRFVRREKGSAPSRPEQPIHR